jgi:hypothetical protein
MKPSERIEEIALEIIERAERSMGGPIWLSQEYVGAVRSRAVILYLDEVASKHDFDGGDPT